MYSASDCAKEVQLETDLQHNPHSSDPALGSRSKHLLLGTACGPWASALHLSAARRQLRRVRIRTMPTGRAPECTEARPRDSGHIWTPEDQDRGEAASRRSLDKRSARTSRSCCISRCLNEPFPPSTVHTPCQHSANLCLGVEANKPPDTSLCGAVRAVQLTRTLKAPSHPKHICLLGSFGNAAKRCVDISDLPARLFRGGSPLSLSRAGICMFSYRLYRDSKII